MARFALKGDSRRDGGLKCGLEDPEGGVTMVGVGVLEGELASVLPSEDNGPLSLDMHAGHALRSVIAESELSLGTWGGDLCGGMMSARLTSTCLNNSALSQK